MGTVFCIVLCVICTSVLVMRCMCLLSQAKLSQYRGDIHNTLVLENVDCIVCKLHMILMLHTPILICDPSDGLAHYINYLTNYNIVHCYVLNVTYN